MPRLSRKRAPLVFMKRDREFSVFVVNARGCSTENILFECGGGLVGWDEALLATKKLPRNRRRRGRDELKDCEVSGRDCESGKCGLTSAGMVAALADDFRGSMQSFTMRAAIFFLFGWYAATRRVCTFLWVCHRFSFAGPFPHSWISRRPSHFVGCANAGRRKLHPTRTCLNMFNSDQV